MFHESQQVGLYTLIKKLGKGGFGEVWLAERRSELVTKKVAVKLPTAEQIDIEAIRQEATLWEQASGHANVLPIIDADIYEGQVVIVSEYAEDGSLYDKLKNQSKFSIKEASEMTIGILSGLEFLHSRRIIHRDIKPANILFQGKTPRLMDFGISRAMQTSLQSSTIVGTNAYMSPESLDGKYSFQSDVWSVGVVLYQLLTGTLPFPQERPTERMFAILQKDFEPLPNDISQELQRIVTKSLAKMPENRYQTTSLMREDLQNFLFGISTPDLKNRPTEVFENPEIPPTEQFSRISSPTALLTDQKSVNTTNQIPFEPDETEPFLQSLESHPGKTNLFVYLFIGVLISGFVIGGVGLLILNNFSGGDERTGIINKNTNNDEPFAFNSANSGSDSNASTSVNEKTNEVEINKDKPLEISNSEKLTEQPKKESTPKKTPTPDILEDEPPPPPPKPTPKPVPKTISGGVVNGKATSLPKPAYPAAARAAGVKGSVNVQVLIDENGNVVSASAVSGHPLLKGSAESAARRARFAPMKLSGQPVKVSGVITYVFN